MPRKYPAWLHVLRHFDMGTPVSEICRQTKLSRQTVWRITSKAGKSRRRGGWRKARCKISPEVEESLRLRIRLYRQDGNSYASKAVEWLRDHRNIIVTPAAIYSWIYRRRR